MKKAVLLIACVLAAVSGHAQLVVDASGRVGINHSTASTFGQLVIGGESSYCFHCANTKEWFTYQYGNGKCQFCDVLYRPE